MSNEDISLFISDIHLSESRPDLTAAFLLFLEETASQASSLYIIGDLFDFWAGDDILTPLTLQISHALALLSDKGVNIYFQGGNRDFAIGNAFATRCKMRLLPDVHMIQADPVVLVLHGDQLCSDDVKYQRYRKWIRHPFVMFILRRLPRAYRLRLARKIREKSLKRRGDTPRMIEDVTESAVEAAFKRYNVTLMIHGHTHKPDRHAYCFGTRFVLSDWDQTADYLKLENGKISRHIFKI